MGKEALALAGPAQRTAVEVLAANGVESWGSTTRRRKATGFGGSAVPSEGDSGCGIVVLPYERRGTSRARGAPRVASDRESQYCPLSG